MAPYEIRVTAEAAGAEGCIYHVRLWWRRYDSDPEKTGWHLFDEWQVDLGNVPMRGPMHVHYILRKAAKR